MGGRSMARGKGPRLAVIVVIGACPIVDAMKMRSPLGISEGEARRIVASHELIGMSLEDAGARLQHRAPAVDDGSVVLDFNTVKGWKAGPLTLDVRGGKVTAATWGDASQGE